MLVNVCVQKCIVDIATINIQHHSGKARPGWVIYASQSFYGHHWWWQEFTNCWYGDTTYMNIGKQGIQEKYSWGHQEVNSNKISNSLAAQYFRNIFSLYALKCSKTLLSSKAVNCPTERYSFHVTWSWSIINDLIIHGIWITITNGSIIHDNWIISC